MNSRGILSASKRVTSIKNAILVNKWPLKSHACGHAFFEHTVKRHASRKTIIKAKDLPPQGVLPPLAKDEADSPPEKKYPTVLQQHLDNVHKYNDCIVLTRVGDFYEMYFDQVEQYAPLVNLKKAKRATALGDVPMAGFQHTQLERYLKMFVQDLGKQVAISEQIRLEEHEREGRANAPKFDRKVTRIITAGTLVDETFMDPYEKNFLLAVHFPDSVRMAEQKRDAVKAEDILIGVSWVDVSSGDFYVQSTRLISLPSLVARVGPQEIVLHSDLEALGQSTLRKILGEGLYALTFHRHDPDNIAKITDWLDMLEREPENPEDFTEHETSAGSVILGYLRQRLFDANIKLQPPIRRSETEYMSIDKQSLRALEIKSTIRDGLLQGSLLHTIRRTSTKSGARLLSQRIVSPSMSIDVINERLDLVQELLAGDALREDVIALLQETHDTTRLLQKFSIGRGDADDMLGLAKTIRLTQKLAYLLHDHIVAREQTELPLSVDLPTDASHLWNILKRLDLGEPTKVADRIMSAIDEAGLSQIQRIELEKAEQAEKLSEEVTAADLTGQETPRLARRMTKTANAASAIGDGEDIWVMNRHASPELLRAHKRLDTLYEERSALCLSLRHRFSADSLTLKWSAGHGHHCHVKGKDKNITLSKVEGSRIISQSGSTRTFYTPEWSHLGPRIDTARQAIRSEEEKLFTKLRAHVLENLMRLRRNAAVLDELDVACSSAVIAKERHWTRPTVNDSRAHRIIGGRHPTVDVGLMTQGKQFTSNDCMVGDSAIIYLLTGPNMAGKSTYLRQNALITILAQTGCFVPAEYADIGLADKIFSRVGSADSLYQDQSTFMVEMLETAEILKQATPRSFVIMDEVGRGTTPEDGVAVGFACLHHLHNVNQCRTLFATHFHALADMTSDFDSLSRHCTDVAEEADGSWLYMHKVRPGVNRRSHALKVAKLAGLPEAAIHVAGKVLTDAKKRSNHRSESSQLVATA